MSIAVLLFLGAVSEFFARAPVSHRTYGQPVSINDVLATMTTSYMLKHAPEDRQLLYVLFSAVPIGLACLWRAFDQRQKHRPKIARAIGAALFLFGAMCAGTMSAFSVISPTMSGGTWIGAVMPAFVLAAIFLAASWPLCFAFRSAEPSTRTSTINGKDSRFEVSSPQ
jgi:hypothetical protein